MVLSRMVEFNFIENRTSMLRGKNERTFCWYYYRRRRRTIGVTVVGFGGTSPLVGPRGAIAWWRTVGAQPGVLGKYRQKSFVASASPSAGN